MSKMKNPNPAIKSFMILKNKIMQLSLPNRIYDDHIANVLAGTSLRELPNVLGELTKTQRFRRHINGYATTVENFAIKPVFRVTGAPEKSWELIKSVLFHNRQEIQDFLRVRSRVENAIILGDYSAAHLLLDKAKNDLGESLWYVRSKILVFSSQGDSEGTHSFCEQYKQRGIEDFITFLINCFQLITDSDNASTHLRERVQSYVREFNGGKQTGVASLLSLMFIPAPIKGAAGYLPGITEIQIFCAIDQYVLILRMLQHELVDLRMGNSTNPDFVARIAVELASFVSDPSLNRLLVSLEKEVRPVVSTTQHEILDFYERGDYLSVVQVFYARRNELENVFAYVNLVAKAMAYLDLTARPLLGNSILDQIVGDLTLIYAMGGGRKQAQERVLTWSIKLHGFEKCVYVQLCLYKALPHFYSKEEIVLASRIAILTCVDATPLTVFYTEYGINCSAPFIPAVSVVPGYRLLKRYICRLILGGADPVEIESKLTLFRQQGALYKDYLETRSQFYLSRDDYAGLASFIVDTLIDDEESYLYMPMESVINGIECEKIYTRDALMAVFYYNKLVSSKKDYVLNETFEEYIISNQVSRPSELIRAEVEFDKKAAMFYKNVCVQEVMDVLTAFKTTIELRAERIKILDALLRRGSIADDVRMREVEEIVGQVIIDAGTREFNRSKIYVDDSSILKKHIAEFKDLTRLFHDAADDGDRITAWNQYNSEGNRNVYASGNKNGIVIKMFDSLLYDFLYDEMHGFDKNLSAEIRHGFFSNLMRARLQENHLIAELDEKGNYQPNLYWKSANEFLHPVIWGGVDAALQDFSKKFNELIAEAEEWMKISGEINAPQRMFSFTLSVSEFSAIKAQVESGATADAVGRQILDLIWAKLEGMLFNIRLKLDGVFRERIDVLFSDLKVDVNREKRSAAMLDLMSAIELARGLIKDDITTVVDWFNRSNGDELAVRSLDRVIEIAIGSFEQIKGAGFGITRTISDEFRNIPISGRSFKSFVIATTNLLDNCYQHSGMFHDTKVDIKGEMSGDMACLQISNSLSDEVARELTQHSIESIDKKMRESRVAMRTEGGSGLTKAFNEILNLSPKADFKIDAIQGVFAVRILYGA